MTEKENLEKAYFIILQDKKNRSEIAKNELENFLKELMKKHNVIINPLKFDIIPLDLIIKNE